MTSYRLSKLRRLTSYGLLLGVLLGLVVFRVRRVKWVTPDVWRSGGAL